mmetsp:Transcript_56194/g.134141  ORF Transcript_56194/g.134141 Transcript_56194/m.134141 type:complete len:240 (+) Transcript_56194:429-1148(+)
MVADPAWNPTVTATALHPEFPEAVRQRTEVSDSQELASHPRFEVSVVMRACTELPNIPKPAPITVMVPPPELGLFSRPSPPFIRIVGASYECDSDRVPTPPAAVIIKRCEDMSPPGCRQCRDVSDCQSDASHAVAPKRSTAQLSAYPNDAPTIVTDIDPVEGRLTRIGSVSLQSPDALFGTRTGPSYDTASETVAARLPAVMVTRRVPEEPAAVLHTRCVSEVHSVASQDVIPTWIFAE